jgi:hypothetical protein
VPARRRRPYRIRLPFPGRIPRRDQGGAPQPLTAPAEGWYRPRHKQQNPDVDPHEPTSESANAGYDHGWSNCTMASGAMALDFHTLGQRDVWAGDLRHAPGQPDMTGGTDLWDVEKAWAHYGEDLDIRSGDGWAECRADHDEGRALILTGEGNVPGSATFDGAHAIAVLPEVRDNGDWLIADPLSTGPEWVTEASLRTWAERLQSSINWARTAAHPPTSGQEAGDLAINAAAGSTSNIRADVPEGTDWFEDANLTKKGGTFSKAATVIFGGNPIGESAEGGSRMVLINTGNVYGDGSVRPTWVYVHAADVLTHSVPPAPTGDIDQIVAEAVEANNEAWRQWLLAESPGS